MQTVSDFFGCHVFGESVMKQKLPKDVFKDVYALSTRASGSIWLRPTLWPIP